MTVDIHTLFSPPPYTTWPQEAEAGQSNEVASVSSRVSQCKKEALKTSYGKKERHGLDKKEKVGNLSFAGFANYS